MSPLVQAHDLPPVTEDADIAILNAADRCDACGVARAYVRATMLNGVVDLCGHHYAKHKDALDAQAVGILDERWQLEEK